MKHFLAISISFIYLVLATGLQITTHYCHGELESVKVLAESSSCCCGDNEMQSNCCSDEIISFRGEIDQHISAENRIDIEQNSFIADILIPSSENSSETEENRICITDFDSPPFLNQPLWLVNCTFTIYG